MPRRTHAAQSPSSDEDYQTPERPTDRTNYDLTPRSSYRNRADDEPSTSRQAHRYFAAKSTSKAPRARPAVSPRRRPTRASTSRRQRVAGAVNPPRRPLTTKQRELRMLRQIKFLQNTIKFLIPRLPFSRLVREAIMSRSREVSHITPDALAALQEMSESYLTAMFTDAYILTLHRRRVTLSVADLQILRLFKLIE